MHTITQVSVTVQTSSCVGSNTCGQGYPLHSSSYVNSGIPSPSAIAAAFVLPAYWHYLHWFVLWLDLDWVAFALHFLQFLDCEGAVCSASDWATLLLLNWLLNRLHKALH